MRTFYRWFKRLIRPKRRRLEVRFVPYCEAEKLMRQMGGVWTIAKEEDDNRHIGWVYLERLEPEVAALAQLEQLKGSTQ